MSAGRNPGWNPVAHLDERAWCEAVVLTSKERLTVPLAARRRLGWGAGVLLVSLEPDGSAELLPWDPYGREMIEALERELARLPPEERPGLALAASDTFLKLTLEGDGRATLPSNLFVHLDAHRTGVIRLVVDQGRLWLWSEEAWRRSRGERSARLRRALDARQPRRSRAASSAAKPSRSRPVSKK